MIIEGIDYNKCIDCGECVKVCPQILYFESRDKKEDRFYFKDSYNLCVKCGHCIALCPKEAILYKDAEDAFNFEGTKKLEEIVPYEDLMKIIRMRRSMRVFKKESVPKEKIEKIIEAMRYAPSASNRQNWRYTVITNKEEIEYLRNENFKFFKMAKRTL